MSKYIWRACQLGNGQLMQSCPRRHRCRAAAAIMPTLAPARRGAITRRLQRGRDKLSGAVQAGLMTQTGRVSTPCQPAPVIDPTVENRQGQRPERRYVRRCLATHTSKARRGNGGAHRAEIERGRGEKFFLWRSAPLRTTTPLGSTIELPRKEPEHAATSRAEMELFFPAAHRSGRPYQSAAESSGQADGTVPCVTQEGTGRARFWISLKGHLDVVAAAAASTDKFESMRLANFHKAIERAAVNGQLELEDFLSHVRRPEEVRSRAGDSHTLVICSPAIQESPMACATAASRPLCLTQKVNREGLRISSTISLRGMSSQKYNIFNKSSVPIIMNRGALSFIFHVGLFKQDVPACCSESDRHSKRVIVNPDNPL